MMCEKFAIFNQNIAVFRKMPLQISLYFTQTVYTLRDSPSASDDVDLIPAVLWQFLQYFDTVC